MSKIKIGDRVVVTSGKYKGLTGTIETKRSTAWVVAFRGGGSAQLLSSQIRRIEVAS